MADNQTESLATAFTDIYSSHSWGGASRSGPGSDPAAVQQYVALVETLIDRLQIKTVLDIGCGDWAFSSRINWKDTHYCGVDVVPNLIADLNSRFNSPTRTFVCKNIVSDHLPPADLCICKDVLQHLSNASAQAVLSKIQEYRYSIVTNDIKRAVPRTWRNLWRERLIDEPNSDTTDGASRPIEILKPPLKFEGKELLRFDVLVGDVVYTKQVVFGENDRARTQ